MILLADVSTIGSGVGIFAAIAFFLIFAVVAYVAFKMLKRTVKMAFRIAVVAVIMAVAVAGSIALWAFSGRGSVERPRPAKVRGS